MLCGSATNNHPDGPKVRSQRPYGAATIVPASRTRCRARRSLRGARMLEGNDEQEEEEEERKSYVQRPLHRPVQSQQVITASSEHSSVASEPPQRTLSSTGMSPTALPSVPLAVSNFETGRVNAPESTAGGQTSCIVCFDRPKTHLAAPCGHQCVCGPCSATMKQCPYCREHVVQWVALMQQARLV